MPLAEPLQRQDIATLYADHHGWLQGWLRKKLGSTPALKHLSDVAKQWSDAQYLRKQHSLQGSAEGMVDSAIRCFRGEPMNY